MEEVSESEGNWAGDPGRPEDMRTGGAQRRARVAMRSWRDYAASRGLGAGAAHARVPFAPKPLAMPEPCMCNPS